MKALTNANVILRFLLDDHPTFSPAATALFERAAASTLQLLIPTAIHAECFYTLKSFYKVSRSDIAQRLLDILSLPGVVALEGRGRTGGPAAVRRAQRGLRRCVPRRARSHAGDVCRHF